MVGTNRLRRDRVETVEEQYSMTTREQELIGEHLDYEIKMLHETRKALMGEPVPTGIIANALMESFAIHARNLNEFFFENSRLKASDFAIGDYKKPENPHDRKLLFDKINKQIAHLTKDRTSKPDEKIGTADRDEMYSWIFAFLEHFGKHVRPELRSFWKIKFGQ
jgi:hypothetical protein